MLKILFPPLILPKLSEIWWGETSCIALARYKGLKRGFLRLFLS
jgi:hypothetical protein